MSEFESNIIFQGKLIKEKEGNERAKAGNRTRTWWATTTDYSENGKRTNSIIMTTTILLWPEHLNYSIIKENS